MSKPVAAVLPTRKDPVTEDPVIEESNSSISEQERLLQNYPTLTEEERSRLWLTFLNPSSDDNETNDEVFDLTTTPSGTILENNDEELLSTIRNSEYENTPNSESSTSTSDHESNESEESINVSENDSASEIPEFDSDATEPYEQHTIHDLATAEQSQQTGHIPQILQNRRIEILTEINTLSLTIQGLYAELRQIDDISSALGPISSSENHDVREWINTQPHSSY